MKITDTFLIVQCAYCKKFIGKKPGEGVQGTSHGICPHCSREIMKRIQTLRPEVRKSKIQI